MLIKNKQNNSTSQQSIHSFGKQISKFSKKKDTLLQQSDLLFKVCCPNCRYIFKTVNQNKLLAIKKKINTLNPILQQKSQIDHNNLNKNNQITVNNVVLPQSLKKKQKSLQPVHKKSKQQQKNPQKHSQITSQQHKNNKSNLTHVILQNSSSVNKKNNNKNQQNIPISTHPDVNHLKKYLYHTGEIGSHKHQSFHHTINFSDQFSHKFKNAHKQPVAPNPSQQNGINTIQDIFNSVSSINKPKRMIQCYRQCQTCDKNSIQLQIVLQAIKSKLIQNQVSAIANYVQHNLSTPSYIKSLGLMLQNY